RAAFGKGFLGRGSTSHGPSLGSSHRQGCSGAAASATALPTVSRGGKLRPVSDRPIIRVQHIVKSFGSVTAVDDVSFDVRAGEIFAFLGPNGAGKTTTIKMLTTLLRPTSSTLELDGLDPTTHQTDVRKRFGVVFQDPSLDGELTAWENMDIHGVLYHVPRQARRERSETLLTMFELWDRRDDMVKTFSGGMKRRLEIARGLLHTPKVLFLDEPTLGLDPQSRNQM